MKFNYQARTKTGEIQSGVVEAASKEAAINVLRSYQLYVTFLGTAAPAFYARKIKSLTRVSKREVVALSRQLAIMFKSEVPVVEVFKTLAKQTKNQDLKEKILNMVEEVEGGNSLSKTFSSYPEVFSILYVNMVKAGEVSGKLSEVFGYLADYLERDFHFREQLKGAMIYPAFILGVFLLIGGAMMLFIIPQLSQILTERGAELPIMTRILMGTSNFLRKWWWMVILALVFLIFFIFFYSSTREGKKFFNRNLLKVPFVNSFLQKIYLSRFALNLSTLISGGLPIVQSLEITGEVVGNDVYKSVILETSEGVKRGEKISSILERYPQIITPLFTQTIVVGEKTGRLDSVLANLVDFYQKEVDRTLENFVRISEPVMIVIFGGLVGGLMVAIIMPLYQIVSGF